MLLARKSDSAWALPSREVADFLKSGGTGVIGSLKLRRVLNTIVVGELALAARSTLSFGFANFDRTCTSTWQVLNVQHKKRLMLITVEII